MPAQAGIPAGEKPPGISPPGTPCLRWGDAKSPAAPKDGRAFSPHASACLLDRLQIYRRGLAATVDLELELDPVALVEADHAGPFHGRNVDEGVGLAVVAADEAEALHRVEEFDRALSLLAGQLALRPAAAAAAGAVAITAAILAGSPLLDRHRL